MTLLQLIDKLYNEDRFDWKLLNEQEKDAVYRKFYYWLVEVEVSVLNSTNVSDLKQIIQHEWRTMELPVDTMFIVYQRLLELELTGENVRDFANYLDLYGYDWQEEKNDMLRYMEHNQLEEVLQVVRNVDYWKWNQGTRDTEISFRSHTHDAIAKQPEPEYETLDRYDHGALRLLGFYYDSNDVLVPKSKAVKYRLYEFNENGTLLRSEIVFMNR